MSYMLLQAFNFTLDKFIQQGLLLMVHPQITFNTHHAIHLVFRYILLILEAFASFHQRSSLFTHSLLFASPPDSGFTIRKSITNHNNCRSFNLIKMNSINNHSDHDNVDNQGQTSSSTNSTDNIVNKESTSSTNTITLLGFGSLLSEKSARTTFPNLINFRLGKVLNYRRVFGHPASIFFQRGIANMDTLEMSSLCAEPCEGSSFICSIFEVSNSNNEFLMSNNGYNDGSGNHNGGENNDTIIPSLAYLEREEEFDIVLAPYTELYDADAAQSTSSLTSSNIQKQGILCTKSTDEKYIAKWGQARFLSHYGQYNIPTIWNWKQDSGLRPCGPYLRHCVLAAQKHGKKCLDSFLDETFLVDRVTTVRDYLSDHPEVMETLPPAELAERYGG